ncbi:MAG: AraC family transcriptional regulator [Rubrivivax sp.]
MDEALPTPAQSHPAGLFRTRLAGRHARLREAFDVLRRGHLGRGHGPDECPLGAGLYGEKIVVSNDPAEGTWELISLRDEVFLIISDCRYAQPRAETVLPEGFVEFHFMLKGPVSVEISEIGQVQIGAPNLTAVCQGDDIHYQVFCGVGPWKSVALYVGRKYMKCFLRDALGPDNMLCRDLAAVGREQVLCRQMRLDVRALTAVEQLMANPFEGRRRLMYAQAKVTEILCVSVDLWQSTVETDRPADVFSARDLRLIEKARDLMIADLARMPTIPQLARAVGTNTSKLKRGFKFLCGMTIFEYGHRQRMNRALHLLIDERMPVNQVAGCVGYQHQTSFTASFREHFGFTPKEARRLAGSDELRARLARDAAALADPVALAKGSFS